MTSFFMIGIVLCGIVGFGGLGGTIYGSIIATGSDYDTLIIAGFFFSAMFIAGSIYCFSLYRKEKAHEHKLLAERGEAFVAAKRKKENSSENTTANTTATQVGAAIPQMQPMAMPVNAA